jgi:hypothetical protein
MTKKAFKEKEKRNREKKKQTELNLPKIPKISQSFVKSLYKYKQKEECGLKIQAQYVEGTSFPSSDVQELENYFEYIATGQLPRDNHVPEPKLLKNGNPAIDYARMDAQKQNFLTIMKRLKFEVEETGFVFTNPKYSGIADIIALDKNVKSKVKNNQRIIIELKTSGLLDNKLNPLGWADESIEEKWDLLIQAIHYKMLAKYEWGIEDIPFYFMVFSNKNDWEYKIFKINVDEATKQQHLANLMNIEAYRDEIMKVGFKAYPDYKRCRDCPLAITCKDSVDVPSITEVYI